jgi:seryl-tRNA synthetase
MDKGDIKIDNIILEQVNRMNALSEFNFIYEDENEKDIINDEDINNVDEDKEEKDIVSYDEDEKEIEIDVSDIVNKMEEIEQKVDENKNINERLVELYNSLNEKLSELEEISSTLESMKNEFVKRLPTKEEVIELRALDSYPYNEKLDDFWKTEEKYKIKKEFPLKIDDEVVNSDYNEQYIAKTL